MRAHGGPQSTAFAVKLRQTERALQARQLAADRGLRNTRLLGCARDLAGGHDGTEHLNLAVAETHNISSMHELQKVLSLHKWTHGTNIEPMNPFDPLLLRALARQ